ncbi:MAG TPA: alpha/beta fold hydrolase [Woeseiaceae bacterium]|nr:alpha/beta fold hydrolase [Woeseiaceae bacterium]
MTETAWLPAAADHRIRITAFPPPPMPRAVVQVLHGMGEHAGRYARFAVAAGTHGFAVVAHDHRGHGPARARANFFAHRRGWDLLVDDTRAVYDWVGERYPGLPRAMLGHSMGSYVAQDFAMRHGAGLGALLLSGSTWPNRLQVAGGHILARFECRRHGDARPSPLLDRLGFAAFNRRIAEPRTDYDWLSRDESEIDRYIADPLTGGPFTAGLWRDLTAGLLRISSDAALRRIPAGLPILISGGAEDAVGGERGMGRLAAHYAQTGHRRLTVKIYPGGRHEMLNEINRDEATADWLAWFAEVLAL